MAVYLRQLCRGPADKEDSGQVHRHQRDHDHQNPKTLKTTTTKVPAEKKEGSGLTDKEIIELPGTEILEEHYGSPRHEGGGEEKIYILQSRPITISGGMSREKSSRIWQRQGPPEWSGSGTGCGQW